MIAEKLDAVIVMGLRNSRMKDYFDLWSLCRSFAFEGAVLVDAIRATIQRRGQGIPTRFPIGLTEEFSRDASKQKQWAAFVKRVLPRGNPPALADVVSGIRAFLGEPLDAVISDSSFNSHWPAGGPWQYRAKTVRSPPKGG